MKDYDLTFLYGLFGETAANLLLYVHRFGDSYATEIARHFSMQQQTVLYHVEKLERVGYPGRERRGADGFRAPCIGSPADDLINPRSCHEAAHTSIALLIIDMMALTCR